MASRQHKPEWELPSMREAHQMSGFRGDFYSVKFYPYSKPGSRPIFAIVGGRHILICRPPAVGKENTKIEVMQDIVEGEPEEDYYTCVWTKDLESGDPLLCVAGNNANIKVIDVLRGKLLRVLPGHGGEIDDLAISPINPYILASASEDSTVRIWSLDPAHAQQPCAAILEGDGHKETVMSIAFHSSGRYLLSGGVDHIINLWTLPEFPDSNTGTNKPTRIYYPHFSTSEIHLDIVDCVCFHGDLILSKAANEECIVLWSINGFSSSNPSPPPSLAPTTHDAQRETRSAFTPVPSSTSQEQPGPQYTRLLQFSTPESPIIFMRFSLYPGSTSLKTNPILAFCNTQSKIYFWDLARLNKYQDFTNSGISIKDSNLRPSFLNPFQHRNRSAGNPLSRVQRDNSPTESSSSFATGNSDGTGAGEKEKGDKGRIDWERSVKGWQDKYEMGDSIEVLEPHKEEMVKGLGFTGRQLAWSADGMWCVVVGSAGVFAVLQRWGK